MLKHCRPDILARGHLSLLQGQYYNNPVLLPADTAGVVTVAVASLVDAGMVSVGMTDLADAGVASLADAGMAFPAEPAGVVTVGVVSLADAGMFTVGVADSADAGAVTLAAPVYIPDSPEYGRSVVSCGDRVSPGIWCMERARIQSDLNCRCVDCVSCDLVGMGCTVPADGYSG